jgi:hypothetical protein
VRPLPFRPFPPCHRGTPTSLRTGEGLCGVQREDGWVLPGSPRQRRQQR